MALKLVKPSEFGIDVEYWNIGSNQEDFKGGGKQIVLYGYLNEKARHDGAQPLTAAQVTLAGDDYVADQDRAGVYASIKGLEDWVGAEDA